MLKKTISTLINLSILGSLLVFSPLANAAAINITVDQYNIGGLNIPIGGKNIQIGEFEVESTIDIYLYQFRFLCSGAEGFTIMRLKHDGETVASAAPKISLGSHDGLEATMEVDDFLLEEDKTYKFKVHANISSSAPNHTTACTIENSSRIRFKDLEDNRVISSKVKGNFGISEGTYPIYIEPAELVEEKQAVIESGGGVVVDNEEDSEDTFDEKVKSLPPDAVYTDEVLSGFDAFKNPFPDTSTNNLTGMAAAELERRNVISGFPDGEFKGDEPVNRAQLAKMLLFARYSAVQELKNEGKFSDVLEGAWYTASVMDAAARGVISGYPDGTFQPAKQVNTAEFMKMISLAFDIDLNLEHSYTDVSEGLWFTAYAGAAKKYDMFPDRPANELQPGEFMSRSEVAIAIYQYLANRE